MPFLPIGAGCIAREFQDARVALMMDGASGLHEVALERCPANNTSLGLC